MITDEEKAKIQADEAYRDEVRRELAARSGWPNGPVWTFVNSAFGIWLLSSVVFALGTVMITNLQDSRRARREALDRARKLDVEIASRIDRFNRKNFVLPRPPNFVPEAADLDRVAGYKEFSDIPMRVLLVERLELEPGKSGNAIEKALISHDIFQTAVETGIFIPVSFKDVLAPLLAYREDLQRYDPKDSRR